MPQDAPLQKNLQRGTLALFAVVMAGVAASIALYGYARSRLAHDASEALERQIQARHALIQETLQSYEETLFSLSLIFTVDERVNRVEFQRATQTLLARHPGILGLQWAPLVVRADREAWEKTTAPSLGQPAQILERDPGGRDRPAADRPEYFPIIFAEPAAANRNVIGSDAAASPMGTDFRRSPGAIPRLLARNLSRQRSVCATVAPHAGDQPGRDVCRRVGGAGRPPCALLLRLRWRIAERAAHGSGVSRHGNPEHPTRDRRPHLEHSLSVRFAGCKRFDAADGPARPRTGRHRLARRVSRRRDAPHPRRRARSHRAHGRARRKPPPDRQSHADAARHGVSHPLR